MFGRFLNHLLGQKQFKIFSARIMSISFKRFCRPESSLEHPGHFMNKFFSRRFSSAGAALRRGAALAVLEQEVVVNSQVIVSTGNDDFRQRRRRHGNVVVDAQALSELWPSSS